MYLMTFSADTIKELKNYNDNSKGRQIYAAVVTPDSGVFTNRSKTVVEVPKIVCPYQVNDIFAIQERWARSDNAYVYEVDTTEGTTEEDTLPYDYRSATTMPIDAARLFARIVSIRCWPVTQDIIDTYLTLGSNPDSYAGVAKVISNYTSGNRLLSKIRQVRNREVLNKSSQPRPTALTPVEYSSYYYLDTAETYSYGNPAIIAKRKTFIAIRQETEKYYVGGSALWQYCGYDTPYHGSDHDTRRLAWSKIELDSPNYAGPRLEYIGEKYNPKKHDPSDPEYDPTLPATYWYYRLDYQSIRIPEYACYESPVLDPSKHVYCWLISAYLSDKEGNIYGKWF